MKEKIGQGELNEKFIDELAPKQGETIFDISVEGRVGLVVPPSDVPYQKLPPEHLRRKKIQLPQVSQPEVVRHYTRLSQQNFSIGTGMYPLGSCTMKHNPRIHEEIAALEGNAEAHPDQPEETLQGSLEVLFGLQKLMSAVTGMHDTSLAPMGGAHGEFTGVKIIRAYHEDNGEGDLRNVMLVPDSAHGTNPATAAMAGYEVVSIKTGQDGNMDMEDFDIKVGSLGKRIAGMMQTQPSTLGQLDLNAIRAAAILEKMGALVYGDGANMNALLGKVWPADLGIHVMHINTHKAFTTPHGGGGPGAGPVMVVEKLAKFLPTPIVERDEEGMYRWATPEKSIGRISAKIGNVAVLLRAFSYIRTMGEEGLRRVSEVAVTNANYVMAGLEGTYSLQYGKGRRVMHEAVIKAAPIDRTQMKNPAISIAKRLIDYGFHPPTVEFPLIVDHALMIEPTETETLENLKRFVEVMKIIANEDQEVLDGAPYFTPVGRLDEAEAGRKPVLVWSPKEEAS